MKPFEVLEHRGDFKIRVFGKDKKELFLNALLGMESGLRPDFRNRVKHPVLTEKHRVLNRFRKSRHIKVSSLDINALLGMEFGLRPGFTRLPKSRKTTRLRESRRIIKMESLDTNALLVDFLSEALYLIQTNKEIYNSLKFKKFTDTSLEAELIGQKVERFGEDIKAVTYHGLNISQNKNGIWEAEILFDI